MASALDKYKLDMKVQEGKYYLADNDVEKEQVLKEMTDRFESMIDVISKDDSLKEKKGEVIQLYEFTLKKINEPIKKTETDTLTASTDPLSLDDEVPQVDDLEFGDILPLEDYKIPDSEEPEESEKYIDLLKEYKSEIKLMKVEPEDVADSKNTKKFTK